MNESSEPIYDSKGARIDVGEVLGRGGEGRVCAIVDQPQQACKLYDTPPNNLQRNKLEAMAALATDALTGVTTWPIDTLHTGPQRIITGFIMPRLDDCHPLHQLYSPTERQQYFNNADWSFLIRTAMRLAEAVGVVHDHGHVIGDVNERNVLISKQGDVHLIDTDSFQVKAHGEVFLCDVGVDLFTPPELQGKDVRGVQRTINHDMFGLAVLIFQLLFMGRHPYVGRYAGEDDMTPQRAIAESRFAFSRTAGLLEMAPPPFALTLDDLPPELAMLFERSFLPKTKSGAFRPLPDQWVQQLSRLLDELKPCEVRRGHLYWQGLSACPWCRIIDEGGPDFFAMPETTDADAINDPSQNVTQKDIELAWQRYRKFSLPDYPLPVFSGHVAMRLLPRPAPPEVLRDRRWGQRALIGLLASMALTMTGGILWITEAFDYVGLIAILGLNAMVVFAAMWAVIQVNARAANEIRQRKQVYRAKSRAVNDFVHRWKSDQQAYEQAVQRWMDRGARLRDNFTAVKNTRRHDEQNVELSRRQLQLLVFLQQFTISEDVFPELSMAQLMLLRSYGVQTAADIEADRLDALPEREQAAMREPLVVWRQKLEEEFSYDPDQPINLTDASRANLQFAQSAQSVHSELVMGADELEKIHKEADQHFHKQRIAAEHLWEDYSQAKVDSTLKI